MLRWRFRLVYPRPLPIRSPIRCTASQFGYVHATIQCDQRMTAMISTFVRWSAVVWAAAFCPMAAAAEPQLLAHWRLAKDGRDASANNRHLIERGIDFNTSGPSGTAGSAARFDGRDDLLELTETRSLQLGRDDLTISLWIHTDAELDDVLGDLVSQYDPETRTGFHLSIQNLAGVTTSQPNYRQ